MTQTSPATDETYSGRTLGFTIPSRDSRGRIVRLDGALDEILSAHEYPAPITHLLAEALVLATLMGSLLKDDGSQVTMQAQTEAGAVNLLVCDYRGGELRGYVDFDEARLSELGANPSLFALFGKGYLAITFDVAKGRGRYQGIVPLEGETPFLPARMQQIRSTRRLRMCPRRLLLHQQYWQRSRSSPALPQRHSFRFLKLLPFAVPLQSQWSPECR